MKDDTISRQAALDALEKIDCSDGVGISSLKCDAVDDAVTAIKALPSAQQWIPCKERLPEPGEYYLVTMQYFGWNCTEYREIDIAKYDFVGWHKAGVLAWCEMPKPWEGGQNG